MKLSIITVCYNSEKTIERTFQSILTQNYEKIEYLIIDGESNDNTLEIIKKYEPVFSDKGIELKIVSEKDNGIYDAMNKGIKIATGEILSILNSDDYFATNEICLKIMEEFNKNKRIEIIYGDLTFFEDEKVLKTFYGNILDKANGFNISKMHYNHPTCFVKKNVYEKVGYFDTKFKMMADKDFIVRCIQNDIKFYHLNLVFVMMDNSGLTGGTKSLKMIIDSFVENKIFSEKHHFNKIEKLYYLLSLLPSRVYNLVKFKIKNRF